MVAATAGGGLRSASDGYTAHMDVLRSMMERDRLRETVDSWAHRGPAVITGAASGIGRAMAETLAGYGVEVVVSDIDEAGVEETARRCRARGTNAHNHRLDVSDRDAVYAHARSVVDLLGVPQLVVNCAGLTTIALIENERDADGRRVFEVNLDGVVNGTDAFLPEMRRAGSGHLINVSSAFGLGAAPLQSSYSASKFAVRGYTESIQLDLLRDRSPVGVHCVCPGAVRTGIARTARYTDSRVRRRVTTVFDHVIPATRPERAARTILAGVMRGRRRIVVGVDGRLLDVLTRLTGGTWQGPAGRMLRPVAAIIGDR
ncbi:SDR family NAD(P)-dependent oxidoreductase [Williamsia sp. MIQD14]|uniref:SDR family NAD(P)-dependent oxidoreductase n=1 Tax=Williamsia sp. MIQD14 TaxID=3425703 RepID=UPI003DA118C4